METIVALLTAAGFGVVVNLLSVWLKGAVERRRSNEVIVRLASGDSYQVGGREASREQIEQAVRSFLYASKGEPSLRDQKLSLKADVLEPVVGVLEKRGRGTKVALASEIDAPDAIHGDREALRQVFFNLLDNAVKYSPPDSAVVVRVEKGDERVRVILENPSSVGESADDAERLLELGFRTRTAASTDRAGAGIGLWVANRLVEAHRGVISVQPGDGKFRVEVELPESAEG